MQATFNLGPLKEELENAKNRQVKRILTNMARDATEMSKRGSGHGNGVGRGGGVDTGAFITSFSFSGTGRGRLRGKSSRNKPRNQNPEAKAAEGFANLVSDINRIDLKNTTVITLRNGAPHAWTVENVHMLKVFQQLRIKYGG